MQLLVQIFANLFFDEDGLFTFEDLRLAHNFRLALKQIRNFFRLVDNATVLQKCDGSTPS